MVKDLLLLVVAYFLGSAVANVLDEDFGGVTHTVAFIVIYLAIILVMYTGMLGAKLLLIVGLGSIIGGLAARLKGDDLLSRTHVVATVVFSGVVAAFIH